MLIKENKDYLLPYDEIIAFEKNDFELNSSQEKYLNENFLERKDEVAYILYTGIGSFRSQRHSVDDFVGIFKKLNLIKYNESWPCLVVSSGASVIWKNNMSSLIIVKCKTERGEVKLIFP